MRSRKALINESRKKKKRKRKPYSSLTYTTGNPAYNMAMFNKLMGTGDGALPFGGLKFDNTDAQDTTTDSETSASEGVGEGAGEGGAMGESLTNRRRRESLEDTVEQDLTDNRQTKAEVKIELDEPFDANEMRKFEAGIKEEIEPNTAVIDEFYD